MKNYINTQRRDYIKDMLDESSVNKSPVVQFENWFEKAVDANLPDANAMLLSTVSPEGKPSARVLLLRNFSEDGFIFYTNYNSKKGKEINENPWVAMTFYWPELERQIRIEGILEKQSAEESDTYFNSRPRESKIGAWASQQSEVVKGRKEIDIKQEELSKKFENIKDIPRPPFWGGYLLKPQNIEFWQGRANRLHDRILYTHLEDDSWKIERLAP